MFSYNYLCVFTLFKKEVYRFLKVGIQTVVGPAISSLLFLAVFSLALGRSVNQINDVNLAEFIAPGLIMMTMLQNSFANAASSIGQSKFQGNIVVIKKIFVKIPFWYFSIFIIKENAGVDGAVVAGKIRESKDSNMGYDAQADKYTNMISAGIIDPTKVVRRISF